MKGAICGDVVGSIYEGNKHNIKNKNFVLLRSFSPYGHNNRYTDDSYLTVAIADGFMSLTEEELKDSDLVLDRIKNYLIKYGFGDREKYFGSKYREWVKSTDHLPYGAVTNGAVMRCSSAGYVARSSEDAYRLGGLTAMPTHSSDSAVKAASVLCEAIYLLRHGMGKDAYREYVKKYYDIPSYKSLMDAVPSLASTHSNTTAEYTIQVAISAFLESSDFEDAVRKAVLIGGDSDTIADVTGALAEAFYGIPEDIWTNVYGRLTDKMKEVVNRFYDTVVSKNY